MLEDWIDPKDSNYHHVRQTPDFNTDIAYLFWQFSEPEDVGVLSQLFTHVSRYHGNQWTDCAVVLINPLVYVENVVRDILIINETDL